MKSDSEESVESVDTAILNLNSCSGANPRDAVKYTKGSSSTPIRRGQMRQLRRPKGSDGTENIKKMSPLQPSQLSSQEIGVALSGPNMLKRNVSH